MLIDSWGFSYLLARRLRRRLPGLPLIKYVAPQVWASRPGRARALARTFDLVLSIVAFEPPILERAGAKVVFVGHPALARDFAKADPARLRARIEAEEEDPILLVLPGSRRAEVERLAPPFEAALRRLKAERPALKVVVSVAPTVAALVREKTARWPGVHLIEDETGKDDAMRAATVALACSGTATTELAAAGCPMVVAYKLGPLTYAIGRRIVRVRYITLFNIAADAEVAPELIQDEATGARIAREIALRLDDKPRRERQIAAQNAALELLGGRGPAPGERAAMAIAEILAAQPRLSMGT